MWFLAIPAVVFGVGALIGCDNSEKEKNEMGPDPETKATPKPKPSPEPRRDPKDLFAQCFAGNYYEIIVENPGRGLCGRFFRFGFRPHVKPAPGLGVCFPTEASCDTGPGTHFGHPFHLKDGAGYGSNPFEFWHSPLGSLVRAETLRRADEFPYVLDGGLYDSCGFALQLWQGVKSLTSGGATFYTVNRNLGGLEMPLYSPRKDGKTCMAEPDFSNEKILHLDAPLCATFPPPGKTLPTSVTATEVKAGADCDNRMGTALPLKVTLNLK